MAATVRVLLHGATLQDYETLYPQMTARGFSDEVIADDGFLYKLPPAEYVFGAPLDRYAVLERAKAAAATTGRSYAVFVTEAAAWCWNGLERLRRAA